jgi:hypothetical protein
MEKPSSTGITDVDQYVDKCFEFYNSAKKLNEKVKAIDVEISSNKLSEQEMKSKKEELKNCMTEATTEQKKAEELIAKSSEMPEKVKAGVSGNPLKAGKAMKNLTKASEAVKEGGVQNTDCIKSIPAVLEKIKD